MLGRAGLIVGLAGRGADVHYSVTTWNLHRSLSITRYLADCFPSITPYFEHCALCLLRPTLQIALYLLHPTLNVAPSVYYDLS